MLGMMQPLATWLLGDEEFVLRRAVPTDVPEIVTMLVADRLGATREDAADLAPYRQAFDAIDTDPAQLLLVVTTTPDEATVGTMQLTFIPGMARRGALRAQVEAVRVRAEHRRRGLGMALVGWAIEEARRRGCALVQLTTDKTRGDAHRFYQRLGFVASHEGLKLHL
jgi:GNAT superfamily N-acetyltransferase